MVNLPLRGTLSGDAIFAVAGILVWWRTAKVLVLHGAPFPFGITIADGRQDQGRGGRKVACATIGIFNDSDASNLLYFAILRAHPSSDKLMRYRLETLALAMPFGDTLLINESRLYWRKNSSYERVKHYRQIVNRYFPKTETVSLNRFRNELVKGMKALHDRLPSTRNIKRIDGLDWTIKHDGSGTVVDDFGREIYFKKLALDLPENHSGESYRVTGLGRLGTEEKTVHSIADLRNLAAEDLVPVK